MILNDHKIRIIELADSQESIKNKTAREYALKVNLMSKKAYSSRLRPKSNTKRYFVYELFNPPVV